MVQVHVYQLNGVNSLMEEHFTVKVKICRFESYLTPQYTHIAQLVRAGILYIQGQGFKSLCEYNNLKSMKIDFGNKTI